MGLLDLRTTSDLATTAVNKIVAALDTDASTFPKAFLHVLGKTLAGTNTTLFKYAGFNLLQHWAETASYEEITVNGVTFRPLVLIGRAAQVDDPYLATPARISVRATCPTGGGDPLKADTKILGDNNVLYRTLIDTEVTGTNVDFVVEAIEGGSVGDFATGELQFIEPVGNLNRTLTALGITAPGVEKETEDAYRARVVEGTQQRPEGGAYADYRKWAQSVSGVRAAYPYSGDPMEVDLYIEGGEAPDYIPDSSLLSDVEAAVNLSVEGVAERRPVNDAVNFLPISRLAIDVEIVGFTGTDAEKSDIEQALDDRLRSRRPFIQGLDQLPRKDVISRSDLGGIVTEVASSYGRTFTSIQLEKSAEQFELYYLAFGETAKAGTVSFP